MSDTAELTDDDYSRLDEHFEEVREREGALIRDGHFAIRTGS